MIKTIKLVVVIGYPRYSNQRAKNNYIDYNHMAIRSKYTKKNFIWTILSNGNKFSIKFPKVSPQIGIQNPNSTYPI